MTTNANLGSFSDIHFTFDMQVFECGSCGVIYGVTRSYLNNRRKDKESWTCINPSCKTNWWYGTSDEEKLKKKLARTEELLRRSELECKVNERGRRAYKGKFNHLKKKIAAGECPCCGAVFKNLRRHMTNKHPQETKKYFKVEV